MIDKNQVQSAMLMNGIAFVIAKMLPETNYFTCPRSGQINKPAIILSCKILWCWISDAWTAVFLKWHQTVWIRPFLLINCSMNNDVRDQLLIANWTEASGNTQYNIKRIHRLNYTEHSRKTFGNQLVMFLLACMFKWTFKTVLLPCILHIFFTVPYGRYYRLKKMRWHRGYF